MTHPITHKLHVDSSPELRLFDIAPLSPPLEIFFQTSAPDVFVNDQPVDQHAMVLRHIDPPVQDPPIQDPPDSENPPPLSVLPVFESSDPKWQEVQ